MKTLTLQQGSPEWAAHRARSLNASELSAAMGLSSYITRSALVKQKATGIAPEIDAATQHRFNKGHEFEAIARPWAEEIIGEELFPVVLAGEVDALPLSASLDGQTLTGDVTWEHKSGNATLLARLDAGVIPDEYHPQMEQGLLLSGATRCLFMASSGDREAMRYAWYESNPELRAKIVPTWRQFQADVAAYVPTEPAAPVMAAPIESLPAVVVQVQGALTVGGNLDAFGQALRSFIERIPARPATDIEFANCEAACKALKRAEDALTQAEDGALAQISDVELMRRTVADLKELARSTRLATEKLVKAEKDARRTEKVMAARQAFETHVTRLQMDIKGVRLIVPMPDFGGSIKGLSSLASIDDKLTAALIAGKAEANTLASRIAGNLQTLDSVPQYAHLFADRQELAYKDAETLELLMQKRVDAERDRIEAERQRIQQDEERKAREAAERQAEAERQRIRAEEQHKAQMEVAEKLKAEQEAERQANEDRRRIEAQAAEAKKAEAAAQAQQAIQQAEAPAAPAPAPWDADEAATLKLGDVNARLAPIHVTADGLRSIGIEPAGREKNATLYRESQFAEICQVLVLHLQSVVQPSEATA
jgi:putative phage-type endonuclease